ncbi:hypothetical protein SLEP1_g33159 [Rubroshorea leprosula]|uniref:Uncharacterized protein n=1 Tax=Rubroshorea leprosula TaxID=152421 RepID=A0AAV5KFR1_9ROSI|nr:hypothetical protein SLEP1_g33159 [Rubroshorea leprosula]
MSVSLEALAMAGADHLEWGIDIKKWENRDDELPPLHLLADDEEGFQRYINRGIPLSVSKRNNFDFGEDILFKYWRILLERLGQCLRLIC